MRVGPVDGIPQEEDYLYRWKCGCYSGGYKGMENVIWAGFTGNRPLVSVILRQPGEIPQIPVYSLMKEEIEKVDFLYKGAKYFGVTDQIVIK